MIRRLFIILSLFLFCIAKVDAQETSDTATTRTNCVSADSVVKKRTFSTRLKSFIHYVDNLLDKRDSNSLARNDTNFMRRIPEHLRIKTNFNIAGDFMQIRSWDKNGNLYKTNISTNKHYTVSLMVAYRGLAFAFAVKPVATHYKDMEYNLNAYGNKCGIDFMYMLSNSFTGKIGNPGEELDLKKGMLTQRMFSVDAYYVFNNRKFSYPAMFTQAWIQKRSCGSFIAGMSYIDGDFHVNPSALNEINYTKIRMRYAGIGAGYGYNLVIHRTWLAHLSVLPQVLFYSRSHVIIEPTNETTVKWNGQDTLIYQSITHRSKKIPYKFPNMYIVGRAAIVHHFGKFFVGASVVANYFNIGDRETLDLINIKWRARLFVGIKI